MEEKEELKSKAEIEKQLQEIEAAYRDFAVKVTAAKKEGNTIISEIYDKLEELKIANLLDELKEKE